MPRHSVARCGSDEYFGLGRYHEIGGDPAGEQQEWEPNGLPNVLFHDKISLGIHKIDFHKHTETLLLIVYAQAVARWVEQF